ncbi:hypothetical protein Taro_029789 [Colocasia esculenta]|uniref:Uncharacterized protein n=1 Tax=Colocasia esculenta TaxID=4460 RepID=A0A843VVY1_COLES|nr:hypothetical protein [Colocasia esculenta]
MPQMALILPCKSVFPIFLDLAHSSPVLARHFQGWLEVVGIHIKSRRVFEGILDAIRPVGPYRDGLL